jgi:hypothetical protein
MKNDDGGEADVEQRIGLSDQGTSGPTRITLGGVPNDA